MDLKDLKGFIKSEKLIRDLKDLKGTTEKTEKNGETEKKDSFHPMILKKFPKFRKFSDISVVKNNQGFKGLEGFIKSEK